MINFKVEAVSLAGISNRQTQFQHIEASLRKVWRECASEAARIATQRSDFPVREVEMALRDLILEADNGS